jgi:predicted GNAT superfamily acetyltransferase
MHIRPLTTIDECRRVAALEREIWGLEDGEDIVPPPVLIVSVKRGGILLGGFDADGVMKGFVYSMPAIKDGRLTQWSHMLGVVADARDSGLGARLKLAQREAAVRAGVELIEWTFDPLQALNAHFNFAKLGVVVEEYEENVYGDSASPLHAGAPTDRFIAEWRITLPHVERRIGSWGQPVMRDSSVAGAFLINPAVPAGEWLVPGGADLSRDDRRLLVEIPTGFSEMLIARPALALEWRMHARKIFRTCFERGYRAVDFFLSRSAGRGHYLLAPRA